MIKLYCRIFFISLFFFNLNHLSVQACPEGDIRYTNYIHRKPPSRCEGIMFKKTISGDNLYIISFATKIKNNTSYGDKFTIKIPHISNNNSPVVTLLSSTNYYQLDSPDLSNNNLFFEFTWDTFVLKKENIDPKSLRALGHSDSFPTIYIPIITEQPSDEYEFVFYTPVRVRFLTFEILFKGKRIYSYPSTKTKHGEISFPWKPIYKQSGSYVLYYVAKIESPNEADQKVDETINFEHNPNWLKVTHVTAKTK